MWKTTCIICTSWSGYLVLSFSRDLIASMIDLPMSDWVYSRCSNKYNQFPCGHNYSIKGDTLHYCHQRHLGGGILCAQCHYEGSHSMLPPDCRVTFSTLSVTPLFRMNTSALGRTLTIPQNAFIGYPHALVVTCDRWRYEHVFLHSFYLCAKCNSLFITFFNSV